VSLIAVSGSGPLSVKPRRSL